MLAKQRKNKKPFIIFTIIVCILIASVLFLVFTHALNTENSTPSSKAGSPETQQQLDAKRNIIENPNSQQASGQNTASNSSIDISSTQTDTNVTIFTKLSNISSGTCKLEVTSSTGSYNEDAPVIYQSEYSSCAGFSVSKTKLGNDKNWTIKITVTSPQESVSNSTTVRITP